MANPEGRNEKVVLSDEEIIQIEALGATLSLEQCADYFGISKVTFYKIMERQPDVAERYKKGKAKAIELVATGLITQALNGITAASCFYLKTQAGWKETQVQEHKQEGAFNMNMLYPKPDDSGNA
jgi:hypothetical protein